MKRIWFWFLSLSRFEQTGVVVLAAHTAVILMLLVNHATTHSPKIRKPISIRTTLSESKKKTVTRAPLIANEENRSTPPENKQPKQPTEPKQPKELIEPTEKEPKQALQPPTKPSKKAIQPSPKQQNRVIQQPRAEPKESQQKKDEEVSKIDPLLLQQIAVSLEAIALSTKVSNHSQFAVLLPPSIEMQTEARASNDCPGYGEMVSAILQKNLDLPEFGQVVAKIEIDESGTVTQCEILETRSRKNAEFLKKRLQELAFPCFNQFGLSENRLNFTITFHNVENR